MKKGGTQPQVTKDRISKAKLGHITTQATKDKISKSTEENWKDVEYKETQSESHVGYKHTQETKDKTSETHKELWSDLKYKRKQSKSRKDAWKDSERREKRSKSQSTLWNNPKYKDKQLKAIMANNNKEPNKCEKFLFKIVDGLFPNQYLLNTKGGYARPAGKFPDIVNLKDKKCIEHYGDLWHANPEHWKQTGTTLVDGLSLKEIHTRDKTRLELIKKEGWKVLIIWEHELQGVNKLEQRLLKFQEVGS